MPGAESFRGTSRFRIVRCIGAGGMGRVYEAFDNERNTRLALKTLHSMTGDSLLRFKKEFRDFQDLQHPNLVSLGELFAEGVDWFFSMELVDGVNIIDYVHSGTAGSTQVFDSTQSGRVYELRLRDAAIQLAEGLLALHTAQKVHCDIKPSNVLVTNDGRVVLLDFGLATDIGARDHKELVDVVGTIHYMAPEQAAGRQPGPPADWYAMGVVLFEALTGKLPFAGTPMEVLMNKQHVAPPSPRSINPATSEDLDALCVDLLRFNPSERPTGPQVLRRLGATVEQRRRATISMSGSASHTSLFVGREHELAQLESVFVESRKGARFVAVHGESGVGKSALVREVVQRVAKQDASVVVFQGTCYERESVPFKAVDGIIDALSRFLQRLPKAEAAAVLPRKAALLAHVFPVLRRIEVVVEAPRLADEPREPREQRGQLFEALRELFQRLTDRRPTVIVIDDMQWADADSLTLLSHILREPDSPSLLLVATVHTSEQAEALLAVLGMGQQVALERLSAAEGRELALALVAQAGVPPGIKAHQVAAEAAGHPLFIHELIRHACTTGAPTQRTLQLEDVVWERISQLEPPARHILQLVCLADGKLAQQTVAAAAGLPLDAFAKQLAVLRVAHLVRTTGVRATDIVAPYHTRIRAAVLARLPEDVAGLHRRIAVALEMVGQADPEALTTHWRGAGDRVKAAHSAAIAAEKADAAFAFERAVTFYRIALELGTASEAHKLRIKLAEALVHAGRGVDAAAMFVAATEGASPADAMVYRQRAAEQLLRAGHFDEAFALFKTVQAAIDMPLADTAGSALARMVVSRARLRLRGLRFKAHDVSSVSQTELARIDTGFAIALALSTVDTIRGADLQTRQLLAALDAGEPYRIARGIALEAAFNAAGTGSRGRARTDRLVGIARELAERIDNPHALGLALWAAGSSAYLEGRFAQARQLLDEAVSIYRGRCRGVAWEVASAQVFSLWSAHYLGAYREIAESLPVLIKDADAREDRYDATNLRTSHTNTVWLALDQPDEARRQLEHAAEQWVPRTFQLPQYYVVHALAQNELYTGNAEAAWARVNDSWPLMKKAHLMRLQIIRIEMSFLRARCALALARAKPADAPSLLASARRDAGRLDAEHADWARALAEMVRACIADAETTKNAAALYSDAATALASVDLGLHAAIARRRHGQLVGGSIGVELVTSAERWMTDQAIHAPIRMAGLFAPSRE
ncbi:MAG: serine/threonine-protein kinase PknK [Kofleriaceae bacterium]